VHLVHLMRLLQCLQQESAAGHGRLTYLALLHLIRKAVEQELKRGERETGKAQPGKKI
jgi:hypothetical protein